MSERKIKGVVIDPGHGGIDKGASGNGIIEKDLTLKISKYMYDRFKELGVPVVITRDSDKTLDPKDRTKIIRDSFGNSTDVIVISNHINAGGGDGAEIIYALRNNSNLSRKILNELEKAGQNSRKYYQRRLPSNPSKDYYFIHRDTPNNESLIVEYGFLDSNKDDVDLLKNNYKELAEAVIKAVSEYKNIKYIPPSKSDYYIVKKGDSLWSISNKYGISVDKLKVINNLNSNILSVGQKLLIKEKDIEPNYQVYIVKKGDSLSKIAYMFKTTVDNIKDINNLFNDTIIVGQKIFVPNKKEEIVYIVKKGDNLYSIANKYNTTVDKLKVINNKKNNNLSIGEKLIIPNNKNNIYVVKKGDSLWKIAGLYNTSVNKIKDVNNLKSDVLNIGDKLIIP